MSRLKKDLPIILSTFVLMIITSMLIFPSTILMGTAISGLIDNKIGIIDPTVPMSVISSTVGVLVVISIVVFLITISLSVKSRKKRYITFRIFGATYKDIRNSIYRENLLLATVSIAVSFYFGSSLAELFIDKMTDVGAFDPRFKSVPEIYHFFISVFIIYFLVFLVSYLSIVSIKKVNISSSHIASNKKNHKITIVKVVIGTLFLIGGLVLLALPWTSEGGLGMGMVLQAILCFIISFSLLGKYIIIGISRLLLALFWRFPIMSLSLHGINKNPSKLISPIALLLTTISFIWFSFDTTKILNVAENKAFERYTNGIAVYNKTEDIDVDAVIGTKTDMTNAALVNDPRNFYKVVRPETSNNHGPNERIIIHGLEGKKFNLNVDVLSGDMDKIFDSSIVRPIARTKGNVGDRVKMISNSTGKTEEFEVVAIFRQQLKYSSFPEAYINLSDIPGAKANTIYTKDSSLIKKLESVKGIAIFDSEAFSKAKASMYKGIGIIISLIIFTYSFIAIINIIAIFFFNKQKENKLLMKIALDKTQYLRKSLYEAAFISLVALMVSVPLLLLSNTLFSYNNFLGANPMPNMAIEFAIIFGMVIITTSISFAIVLVFRRKNYKSLNTRHSFKQG